MIHELKTWPILWDAVNTNLKHVELREADRNYQRGDILVLKEWNPDIQAYSGRECRRRVTHIVRGEGLFGLAHGYVAMSLVPIAPEQSSGLLRAELVDQVADELEREIISQRKYVPDKENGESICTKLDLALLAEKTIDAIIPRLSDAIAERLSRVERMSES